MTEYIDKAKAYEHFAKRENNLREEVLKSALNDRQVAPQWASVYGQLTEATLSKFYIMNTPPANVKEIIYAHWILEREPDGNPYCYHCSHCDVDFHNIGIKCASKYCPDCGATMNEEIEDSGQTN